MLCYIILYYIILYYIILYYIILYYIILCYISFLGKQLKHKKVFGLYSAIVDLPKGRTNNNIIPEFKVKLNIVEFLIQVEPTEVTLTLPECLQHGRTLLLTLCKTQNTQCV